MLTTSAAKLAPRACAICSSTAQNSGSSAIDVAWPDRSRERFLRVATPLLYKVEPSVIQPLPKVDACVIFICTLLT
jgi:hypothetical protein